MITDKKIDSYAENCVLPEPVDIKSARGVRLPARQTHAGAFALNCQVAPGRGAKKSPCSWCVTALSLTVSAPHFLSAPLNAISGVWGGRPQNST